MNSLKSAIGKSCNCNTQNSLDFQIKRLKKSLYPQELIESTLRKLLNPFEKSIKEWEPTKVIAIPQVHGFTHRMKDSASEHYIKIVSTYRNKLGSLPIVIGKMKKKKNADEEQCQHNIKPFPCHPNSIYSIRMSCGSEYIGETGRCPNLRLEEHLAKKSKYSGFVEHQNTCKCTLDVNGSFLVADGT